MIDLKKDILKEILLKIDSILEEQTQMKKTQNSMLEEQAQMKKTQNSILEEQTQMKEMQNIMIKKQNDMHDDIKQIKMELLDTQYIVKDIVNKINIMDKKISEHESKISFLAEEQERI